MYKQTLEIADQIEYVCMYSLKLTKEHYIDRN